ncbi:UDP-N-acetylglucosamine 4,6-dehydratase [Halolactibacillus miurensis]|uniref:NDP-sugar epimerase, includes UDP-GlcNAc-inverting 4,6-dehydratase FlaA1 and capsular polysaccharide biosynthesis protein EpsC n=1 Tax=Halolactibacillus miurensis TaxID=306541 RepID=A0A1I6SPG0_9BACI|nr:nucleoside-diphosphate sugar epimerase/dehydratase [Halolactibacillus miurensis]GEM04147.1 UDP-N-acetylglucosamine 4,6-dehydratase [Halolactibacillus miurensis]SFS78804.1 NDP-sugar epimerase, includes UDP-GlcNAc-inverting 4,6-dehydratase FlaA1 and capsular polysaccharide biosynthesis protein EpsC [Halolactibacillus miurensis]
MSYRKRMLLLVLLDSLIVASAVYIASWIVYPSMEIFSMNTLLVSAVTLLLSHHLFAFVFKLYHKVWAYASIGELVAIVKAVTLTILTTGFIQYFVNDFSIYRRGLFVTWLIHILFIGGSRFAWRVVRDRYIVSGENKKRTLIVGAGAAGAMIARQLKYEASQSELDPIGFVDDDTNKQRLELYNLSVIGTTEELSTIVKRERVEHIVIAIPSVTNGKLKRIITLANDTGAKVQILPKIEDLASGKVSIKALRNVDVEDVLGRPSVELDINSIKEDITCETVMVTGAGGSIGSEITRQIMRFKPKQILLVGHGEYSIYKIDRELKRTFSNQDTEIIPIIADVQDRKRIFDIVEEYQPKFIYHAAAHKHVPLMEYNPHEAVKNNVMGTKNVAEAADYHHVDTFVLVSTDKAVNPTNVMGATKRLAEMIVQDLGQKSETTFVAVRFGNVLGSRGSVIPLFKQQIADGGPVTVTHEDMTRYFMTIPEASRLVIQASTLARGGEVFVLDMGEPVKIIDLAKNVIKLSGYTVDEIGIKVTGIRPGEKMYEELLDDTEVLPGEVFEKIYVGRTGHIEIESVLQLIAIFKDLTIPELRHALMNIVYHQDQSRINEALGIR